MTHTHVEKEWEMKATSILFVLIAMAMAAVVTAQPVNPAAVHASQHAMEPLWMVLSGATLLGLASVVRRYLP